jgi:biopolymer transport protein TolQ
MQDAAIETVGLAGAVAGPSFFHLFMQADLFTKAVMLGLLLASVWSWAVIIDKSFRLMRLVRKANGFERQFWSGAPLDDLYRQLAKRPDHPMALMFATAMEEWRESPRTTDVAFNRGLVGRIAQVMDLTRDREVESLETNLSWLGTIASTAPFVGLLGTVWGIMNSFQAIAATKNSTLAVVAPGIAEALFATALGLIAAIPALIAYNKLSGSIDRYANRLTSFSEEFAVVLSRELDQAKVS